MNKSIKAGIKTSLLSLSYRIGNVRKYQYVTFSTITNQTVTDTMSVWDVR